MSLVRLTIQNIVLIESLTLDLQGGLCALTGETGAGKSILLDSLALALGARSDSGLIRRGADKASVTATFEPAANHPVYAALAQQDLDIAAGEPLILRRVLTDDGRSRALINDQPVSVKLLSQIGEMLVEIHGQFETQGLLNPASHAGLLDGYAGHDMIALSGAWRDYKQELTRLEALQSDLTQSRAEEEYLRGAIEDLDALQPRPQEESELAAQRERLMNRERVMEALNTAYAALNGDADPVRTAWAALERVAGKMGEGGQTAIDTLARAAAEAQEARSLIRDLSATVQDGVESLESIDERLYALRQQARKHHCTVDDLAAVRDDLAARLNRIEHAEDVLAAQIKAKDRAYALYTAAAQAISQSRAAAAHILDRAVAAELEPLKLGKAHFVTALTALPETAWGAGGWDEVRFLVSTNPGQPPQPIGKIASGGEMARFMLALKVVMAAVGTAETLIFDEVDAGIGGSTADAVGERLAILGRNRQVLVVTHAPQVAARAAHHYIVEKTGEESAQTHIRELLAPAERQEEIARMLAGSQITPEARAAALRLLENAA